MENEQTIKKRRGQVVEHNGMRPGTSGLLEKRATLGV